MAPIRDSVVERAASVSPYSPAPSKKQRKSKAVRRLFKEESPKPSHSAAPVNIPTDQDVVDALAVLENPSPLPSVQDAAAVESILKELGIDNTSSLPDLGTFDNLQDFIPPVQVQPLVPVLDEEPAPEQDTSEIMDLDEFLPKGLFLPAQEVCVEYIPLCSGKFLCIGLDLRTMESCFSIKGFNEKGTSFCRLAYSELCKLMELNVQTEIMANIQNKPIKFSWNMLGLKFTILQVGKTSAKVIKIERNDAPNFSVCLAKVTLNNLRSYRDLILHISDKKKIAAPMMKEFLKQVVEESSSLLKDKNEPFDFLKNSYELQKEAYFTSSDSLFYYSQFDSLKYAQFFDGRAFKYEVMNKHRGFILSLIIDQLKTLF